MKDKLLVLNMKMYMDIDDVNDYIDKVEISDNVILCPEAIYLPYFLKKYKNIAVQSIYPADLGAYTGCISAYQVKKMGVKYAIIGHSECRKYLNVSDSNVNEKIKSAIKNGLIPIMCIGESLEEKQNGLTKKVLKKQLDTGLNDISCDKMIIAYEPIYSIGTGFIPSDEDIIDTISYIKEVLKSKNLELRVIYGGSVSSKNIKSLSKIDIVDGFMVGKSSTVVSEVIEMEKLLSC